MHIMQLRKDFYWTGVIDENLRVFDIIMYTEFGTTYNSYVLKAGDKTILFETAKAKFLEDYLGKLKELINVTDIDYLVVSHTEPDHAGSVEKLLELSPQMKILATACALGFLKEIVNRDFVGIPVKDRGRMEIGNKTLQFLIVPNLHWPDTMYTFIEEEQILVTCDSFGAHYAHDGVLASTVSRQEDYLKAARYYFDCIMGPFKPFVQKALKRVREMDLSMICTGHGPVLNTKESIRLMTELYGEWSFTENPNRKKTVIIPYVSAYGYTKELAEAISEGIKASGDTAVRSYDLTEADRSKVEEELLFADGILFGSPTILGDALAPVWELTLSMFPGTHGGKWAGAFGSYGWSGEAVPNLLERMKQLRMKTDEGFRVRFKPSAADLTGAYEYGFRFGCRLLDINTVKSKKAGARTLVKCLVCGEIFDSSLEICPVCGVGKDHFVPVEAEETTFLNPTDQEYVILGNGAAGISAARAIRARDQTGSVTLISREPFPSYNRPMLTKTMIAGLSPEQIAMEEPSWYEKNKIRQILGRRILSVDREENLVCLDDHSRIHFTRLIYALGSECFLPPIPGIHKAQVTAIRRFADVKKVENLIKQSQSAVVIGGGVLGLEAAWELKKAGLAVTVLEAAPVLMERQLDETAGNLLKKIAEKNGISVCTGAAVASIDGEPAVTGVSLATGEHFPADLVILSTGVRANRELAEAMGLATDRAVIVDSHMATGAAHIYAAGDCAEYKGANYAIWPQALEQGKVAGANAAGDSLTYAGVPAALTFHGMNTSLYAAGDNGKNPNLLYKTIELKDMGKEQYKKYYFLNNRLCGVILIGDLSRLARVSMELERHASPEEVMR